MEKSNHSIESVYKTFSHRLKEFIRRRVPNDETAEDILHETFLKMHEKIDSLKDEHKLEAWLYQIARNAVVDYYRSRKQNVELSENFSEADDDKEEDAMQKISQCVKEFVSSLPEPYRQALHMVEYEGVKQTELAKRLGISVSGAKSRVQRARQMLKDMLMNCCHFEFDRYGTIIDYHPISCCCCSDSISH